MPRSAFENRKKFMQAAFQKGEYLKDPEHRGQPPANPLTDPGGMDQMMNMMKGNMVMFIPQTVIMGWINFFFSGFVLRIPLFMPCLMDSQITVSINNSVQKHVTVWC
jgi:ER membrane protein complex subunit 3